MDYVKTPPPLLKDLDANGKVPLSVEEVLEEQLYLCSDEFTVVKEVKVAVCSWNIDQKKPAESMEKAFREWLMVNAPDHDAPKVIAVGFQELDMSTNALLREETDNAKPWIEFIKKMCAGRYEVIVARQLVGLMMVLLVENSVRPYLKNVTTGIVRCGVANTIANKGSIGVRFDLHKTSFAFATAHLAAHQAEVERRNKDFERITDTLHFQTPLGSASFLSHERVFFFGDLNYRIDLPYDHTLELVEAKSWDMLLNEDQLNKRFRTELKLRGDHSPASASSHSDPKPANMAHFVDLTPRFPPTYKYNPGTTTYDTSEKKRVPAWTDRILHKASDGIKVLDFGYNSELLASDHRPVQALFDVKITEECPDKKKKKEESIRNTIKKHGVFEARITLSESTLPFGAVTYGDTKNKDLYITNNGLGVVCVHVHSFEVLSNGKDDHMVSSRSWISVEPHMLRLEPKQTKPISVKCCIDREALACLSSYHPFQNKPYPTLSHLLVISAGQHRCWVETTCNYRFSCFGSRLSHLECIGLTPISKAYLAGPEMQKPLPKTPSIPKELWLPIDYISKHGQKDPDLFQGDLDFESFKTVQQYLDDAPGLIPADYEVTPSQMSLILLIFLGSLQDPVIPYRFYQGCLLNQKITPGSLPAINYNVLTYLMAFLKYLLLPEHQISNKLTPEIVAHTFAPILLRKDPNAVEGPGEQQRAERSKATAYILNLLEQ